MHGAMPDYLPSCYIHNSSIRISGGTEKQEFGIFGKYVLKF